MLFNWIVLFHLIGLALWVGGLLAVTRVFMLHSQETSPEVRAALGRLETRLLNRLAHPGAALVLIAGPSYMPAAYRETPLARLLLNAFVVVHNGDPDRTERIVKGHERVIRARLVGDQGALARHPSQRHDQEHGGNL